MPPLYQIGINPSRGFYTNMALLSFYQSGNKRIMVNNIEKIRKKLGITREKLAERLGTTPTTIYRKERGDRQLKAGEFAMYAKALGCSVEELISNKSAVPILGYIGAGEQVYPIDDLPLIKDFGESERMTVNCEFAEAPPGEAAHELVALRVKGDSMEPFLREGSLIYYGERRFGEFDEFLNQHVVVGLTDGRLFLKILKKGFTPGKYCLLSHNASLIEDVSIAWCAKVLFIKMA